MSHAATNEPICQVLKTLKCKARLTLSIITEKRDHLGDRVDRIEHHLGLIEA